jgi:hypothetical protein
MRISLPCQVTAHGSSAKLLLLALIIATPDCGDAGDLQEQAR